MKTARTVRLTLSRSLAGSVSDAADPESKRPPPTNILADYSAGQAEIRAEVIMEADARQFASIMQNGKSVADAAVDALEAELSRHADSKASEDEKERLAKRQANAALALLALDRTSKVWPVLKHSPSPLARSYLINRMASFGADPTTIIKRLSEEADVSVRRALILSIGGFSPDRLSLIVRQSLISDLLAIYRDDPDPGMHGAAEWLLRRWSQEQQLQKINQHLTTAKTQSKRQWYMTRQGHTMVIIPGPVVFAMGSPETESGRLDNELPHPRRIASSFAMASKEVTIEQYQAFLQANPHVPKLVGTSKWGPAVDCPQAHATWYEAAQYCNWLSEQEELPEHQWCYVPNESGSFAEGMKPAPDMLNRTGYRLPTEAEWEYACRAGAATAFSYGEAEGLLNEYAWFVNNSGECSRPVGCLRPNDLGLFDMHGNVWEWCHVPFGDYPKVPTGAAAGYIQDTQPVTDKDSRVLRGGSFLNRAPFVRAAFRGWNPPNVWLYDFGFRVARTCK